MSALHMRLSILWLAILLSVSSMVSAQNFPTRPIRIIATEVGGSGDFLSRLIAQDITGPLGQPVIVENRSGANMTGMIVAKATPDGHTLLLNGSSFWLGPLFQKTPYDLNKDFATIGLVSNQPHVMAVYPGVPVSSVKDMIALAKAKPGELNYGNTAFGGAIHLAAELFKSMSGVNIVSIPYKGTAAAVNDLIGGRIQVMFPPAGVVSPHAKSGRLRALAVTSAQPSPLAPGLPTVAAAGLPGYEMANMVGLFAPAQTPATTIKRLNLEIVTVLNKPDIKEKIFNFGSDVVTSTPEQFAAAIKADVVKITKLIKDVGIPVE